MPSFQQGMIIVILYMLVSNMMAINKYKNYLKQNFFKTRYTKFSEQMNGNTVCRYVL